VRIGDLSLHPVSDGTFVVRPAYFGSHVLPGAHPEFFSRHQAAWLPIGCFLVRAGERLVLIDAGLGPDLQQLRHGMHLVGGQLLTGLRALGVSAADINERTLGTGAHFPELQFGRILTGTARRWLT
jgi:hypothetical protein